MSRIHPFRLVPRVCVLENNNTLTRLARLLIVLTPILVPFVNSVSLARANMVDSGQTAHSTVFVGCHFD